MTRHSEKDLLTFGSQVRYKLVVAQIITKYNQLVETEHLFSDKTAAYCAYESRRWNLQSYSGNSAWTIWLKDLVADRICERAAMNEGKLPERSSTGINLSYGNPALYKLVMAEIPEGGGALRESIMYISDFLHSDREFNHWQHYLEYHDYLSDWIIWVTSLELGKPIEYDAMEAGQILPENWDWKKNA